MNSQRWRRAGLNWMLRFRPSRLASVLALTPTGCNILDYAHTAEQVALMARQLDALIQDAGSTLDSPALDKRIADLNALSGPARTDAKSVLNHAFLLAAALIVLALASALVYRRGQSRSDAR